MIRTIKLSAKLAMLVAILLMFTALVGAVGLYNTTAAMKRLEASLQTMQGFDEHVLAAPAPSEALSPHRPALAAA